MVTSITGYTATRMQAIENASVIDGDIVGDNLILKRFDQTTINAGNVRGPQGIQGPAGQNGDVTVAQLNAAVANATLPPGFIAMWAGSTAPSGWLLCDNGQYPIASNASLYAVIGTRYGALTNGSGAAGTTHFRTPLLIGRVPVGITTGVTPNTNATISSSSTSHGHTASATASASSVSGSTGTAYVSGTTGTSTTASVNTQDISVNHTHTIQVTPGNNPQQTKTTSSESNAHVHLVPSTTVNSTTISGTASSTSISGTAAAQSVSVTVNNESAHVHTISTTEIVFIIKT